MKQHSPLMWMTISVLLFIFSWSKAFDRAGGGGSSSGGGGFIGSSHYGGSGSGSIPMTGWGIFLNIEVVRKFLYFYTEPSSDVDYEVLFSLLKRAFDAMDTK